MTTLYVLIDADGLPSLLVDQNGEVVTNDVKFVPADGGTTAVIRGLQAYAGPMLTKTFSELGAPPAEPDPAETMTLEDRIKRLETAVKALAPQTHPETPGDDYRHRH